MPHAIAIRQRADGCAGRTCRGHRPAAGRGSARDDRQSMKRKRPAGKTSAEGPPGRGDTGGKFHGSSSALRQRMLFRACQFEFVFPRPVLVMGVMNVTPDSFYDGGKF